MVAHISDRLCGGARDHYSHIDLQHTHTYTHTYGDGDRSRVCCVHVLCVSLPKSGRPEMKNGKIDIALLWRQDKTAISKKVQLIKILLFLFVCGRQIPLKNAKNVRDRHLNCGFIEIKWNKCEEITNLSERNFRNCPVKHRNFSLFCSVLILFAV